MTKKVDSEGPRYYITKGLNQKWLGILFSILITITFAFVFNTVQSNTIAESLNTQYNVSPVVTGIILAYYCNHFGGVRSIATLSSLIVPIMAIIYIGMVLVILLLNIDQIVPMIGTIIKSAFGFEQVTGGAGARFFKVLNVVYSLTRYGFCAKRRTAVPHPVKQGLIQSLGVFFDTMLVCTPRL